MNGFYRSGKEYIFFVIYLFASFADESVQKGDEEKAIPNEKCLVDYTLRIGTTFRLRGYSRDKFYIIAPPPLPKDSSLKWRYFAF